MCGAQPNTWEYDTVHVSMVLSKPCSLYADGLNTWYDDGMQLSRDIETALGCPDQVQIGAAPQYFTCQPGSNGTQSLVSGTFSGQGGYSSKAYKIRDIANCFAQRSKQASFYSTTALAAVVFGSVYVEPAADTESSSSFPWKIVIVVVACVAFAVAWGVALVCVYRRCRRQHELNRARMASSTTADVCPPANTHAIQMYSPSVSGPVPPQQ